MNTTKTRADAKWNELTIEQRQLLEQWLLDEGMGYDQALTRARAELGFSGSRASLQRFVQHVKVERMERGFLEAAAMAKAADKASPGAEELQRAAVAIASQQLVRLMVESPDDPKKWLPLAKWVGQMARNSSWERVKDEENLVRLKGLKMAEEQFEHKFLTRALKALPVLQDLAWAKKNPQVSDREEDAMWNWGRRKLFGNVPLTPQEEADVAEYERKCERRLRHRNRIISLNIGSRRRRRNKPGARRGATRAKCPRSATKAVRATKPDPTEKVVEMKRACAAVPSGGSPVPPETEGSPVVPAEMPKDERTESESGAPRVEGGDQECD